MSPATVNKICRLIKADIYITTTCSDLSDICMAEDVLEGSLHGCGQVQGSFVPLMWSSC